MLSLERVMAKQADLSSKNKVGKTGWNSEKTLPTFPTKLDLVGKKLE